MVQRRMAESRENTNFLTKKTFTMMVENLVRESTLTYMETIVEICEREGIEIEDIKKYLSEHILNNIEAEARSLNFLPKINTLDV